MSDTGVRSAFDVSVNTPATVFPQELLSRLHVSPYSSSLRSDILKELEQRQTRRREEDTEKRAVINTKRIDLNSGLHGFACLPVIVVCSLSISAPGNYWLVLIGKLLISCSLALFN